MPGDLVTRELFEGWKSGNRTAFKECRRRLVDREGQLARDMLTKRVDGTLVYLGNPDFAISRALEIMDGKVSDGQFLVVTITGSDTSPKRYGRETGQEFRLGREFEEWRSGKELHSYFRKVLQRVCLKELSDYSQESRSDEASPVSDEGPDGAQYGVSDPPTSPSLSREMVQEIIYGLAKAAECLRREKHAVKAEVAEAIILYVKTIAFFQNQGNSLEPMFSIDTVLREVLNSGVTSRDLRQEFLSNGERLPKYAAGRMGEGWIIAAPKKGRMYLVKQENDTLNIYDIEQLKLAKIERLLRETDVEELSFDNKEIWEFVRRGLGISRGLLHKRKQLFYEQLQEIDDELPERFRRWVRSLIAKEAANLISDCERCIEIVDENPKRTLIAVRDYFKWKVGQHHYKYRDDLDQILSAETWELIGHRIYIDQWEPGEGEFRLFIDSHRTRYGDLNPGIHLQELIASLRLLKRKPMRLLSVLGSMLSDVEEGGVS